MFDFVFHKVDLRRSKSREKVDLHSRRKTKVDFRPAGKVDFSPPGGARILAEKYIY